MMQNVPGEMFTHSYLKNLKPHTQFLFATALGVLGTALAHYTAHTHYAVSMAVCIGFVFFTFVNPLIAVFHDHALRYFLWSLFFLVALIAGLTALAYALLGTWLFYDLDYKIILITVFFYFFVASGSVRAMKIFLDSSGGGL